ncbi:hypothetical protein PUR49_01590 [Streptomyces sp. BE147]|uniref:hypothetical protein n=1 Tax=Streptomyces sp. BE147 TaxID=3002524 RepID=UPI002E79A239|nr:hypothetical protein [Streptomyces sp. BE147]MEE1735219.1 hypothetical protein [Streptomyces sp. BE147]MEE1735238.1 hypothetical protein [Streptomyces sp. BE147]
MRTLRIASAVEAVSLALLLLNLFTVHAGYVSSLGGPVHGTAYLVTVLVVWNTPGTPLPGTRWRAVIPGVGGLLALRRMRRKATGPAAAN